MGKASRMKKERKEQGSASITGGVGASHGNQAIRHSAKAFADAQALFAHLGGGNLVVIDEHGVAGGEEQAQQMYWTEVCEGIHNLGASCLPEMVALGRVMNLSIFDVEVPVVEQGSGQHKNEDILAATFLLGHLDCFQWLLGEARRTNAAWRLVGQVFKKIVACAESLDKETPQMTMAKMIVRFMAETFHREGVIEEAMADDKKVMAQPFARRIAQDYLEEVAAAKERAELDAIFIDEAHTVKGDGLRI